MQEVYGSRHFIFYLIYLSNDYSPVGHSVSSNFGAFCPSSTICANPSWNEVRTEKAHNSNGTERNQPCRGGSAVPPAGNPLPIDGKTLTRRWDGHPSICCLRFMNNLA